MHAACCPKIDCLVFVCLSKKKFFQDTLIIYHYEIWQFTIDWTIFNHTESSAIKTNSIFNLRTIRTFYFLHVFEFFYVNLLTQFLASQALNFHFSFRSRLKANWWQSENFHTKYIFNFLETDVSLFMKIDISKRCLFFWWLTIFLFPSSLHFYVVWKN